MVSTLKSLLSLVPVINFYKFEWRRCWLLLSNEYPAKSVSIRCVVGGIKTPRSFVPSINTFKFLQTINGVVGDLPFYAPRKGYMPQTDAQRNHYISHKEYYQVRNVIRRAYFKAIIEEEKSKPCVDCGRIFSVVAMDFHHLNPAKKKFGIGNAGWKASSEKDLRRELAKCILLCANCHRIREDFIRE